MSLSKASRFDGWKGRARSLALSIYFSPHAIYFYGLVLVLNFSLLVAELALVILVKPPDVSASSSRWIGNGWPLLLQPLLIHRLELALTLLLVAEVAIRLGLTGRERFLRSSENTFDLIVAVLCCLFLVVSGIFGSELEKAAGQGLIVVRTLLRCLRIWVFFYRHRQRVEGDDEVNFVRLESGDMIEVASDLD